MNKTPLRRLFAYDLWANNRVLDTLEARLLQAARGGMCFGELCALAAEERGQAHAATLAAEFLGRWVDEGLVVAAEAAG